MRGTTRLALSSSATGLFYFADTVADPLGDMLFLLRQFIVHHDRSRGRTIPNSAEEIGTPVRRGRNRRSGRTVGEDTVEM